jgi:hypothetical protein
MYIGGAISCHCIVRCLCYHGSWVPEAMVFGEVTSVVDSSKSVQSLGEADFPRKEKTRPEGI